MNSTSRSHGLAPGIETAPGAPGGRLGSLPAVLALLLCAPSAASAQFSAQPAVVMMEPVDSAETAVLTVQNQGAEPIQLRVYLGDYDRTPGGEYRYLPLGEHGRSCAERLEIFPSQLSLPAAASGQVRVRIQPGGEVCWGLVFIEQRTLSEGGMTVAQRIGIKVLAQQPGLVRTGEVIEVRSDPGGEAGFVTFRNEGRGVVEVTGDVEVRDLQGEIVAVLPVESFQVLPGRQRTVRVTFEEAQLDPGQYLLVAIMDFGGDYLAGAQGFLAVDR